MLDILAKIERLMETLVANQVREKERRFKSAGWSRRPVYKEDEAGI